MMKYTAFRIAAAGLFWSFGTTLPASADSFSDLAHQVLQQSSAQSALSDSDIAAGLKAALAKGTHTAVTTLGRSDGFWGDPQVRIPLPGAVSQIQNLLQSAGFGPQLDDLHLQMNRAAEAAIPVAADVFSAAVQQLTLNDVRNILSGPSDAATQYFKRTTSETLASRFRPIVSNITAKSGLVQQYNGVIAKAGPAAGLLGERADVNDYVTRKALDGLFLRIGDEEKDIRQNPAARTSAILQKVFGK